jgi:hypothetical protein
MPNSGLGLHGYRAPTNGKEGEGRVVACHLTVRILVHRLCDIIVRWSYLLPRDLSDRCWPQQFSLRSTNLLTFRSRDGTVGERP